MNRKSKQSPIRRLRRGAAVIEFAVCLPLIVLIVFGGIQAANMLFLRQTLVQASYEGIKTAVKTDGDSTKATAAAQAVCDGRNLQNVTISIIPTDVTTAARGSIVEVTITAPGDDNSIFPFGPFAGKNVTASAFMVKE